MERVRALFSGHVQGVGFRFMVSSLSARFDVTGFVRNLADGRVEMAAEGRRNELEAFVKAVETSYLQDHIRQTQLSWSPATGEFQGFEIAV